MKEKLLDFLDVEPEEAGRVYLLLAMSFFMGVFLATLSVASQALFLSHFDETNDLPKAFLLSGTFGLTATVIYNFLQNRIPFPLLALGSLLTVAGLTAFMEFGRTFFTDPDTIYFFGFTQLIPFTFITYLVFWGAFTRMFNLRQSKRLVGTVDMGGGIASFIAFFSIPQILNLKWLDTTSLYTVSLASIVVFLLLFLSLALTHLNKSTFAQEKEYYKKVDFSGFFKSRYILYMSAFVVVSMISINFVEYSFLNVTTLFFDEARLANFISYFEMTIVIFGFLFQMVATDKITSEYGMRISLLINPILIALFTVAALVLGSVFGYEPTDKLFVLFFLMIAMSKLFVRSMKDSMDNPTFKLYLLPIESHIRIDVQTKVEGMVTALATIVAGLSIMLITHAKSFDLMYITIITVPLIALWYVVINKMHHAYENTLHDTLKRNKEKNRKNTENNFSIDKVLENEVNSTQEDKVMFGLKLMEKLEPSLFEVTLLQLSESPVQNLRVYAKDKLKSLGLDSVAPSATRQLASDALKDMEDHDLMALPSDKLTALGKSPRQNDRLLVAKLLRKRLDGKTIFTLLELLRDVDPRVRIEALYTARKAQAPETWPLLIELLGSPSFGNHAAAALVVAGDQSLPLLESAFHKSGQQDQVMLRIVQVIGRIGTPKAMQSLWNKADYPDRRIVNQILYSFRYKNHKAEGRNAQVVLDLLDVEIGKTLWNLAALNELPHEKTFALLHEALTEEVAENYNQITLLLSLLYDPQSVQLVHENFTSGDPDSIAFSLELMDLFIEKDLKQKLFPLFDDIPTEEKLHRLQLQYPREKYNPIQVINYLINRDFNQTNRWTKACALHAAAYIPEFRISRGLIAQLFNHDHLLQETAAWVIFNKDRQAYLGIAERLPHKDKKYLDSAMTQNQLLDGLDDGFFLNIEMIMFIKNLSAFNNVPGIMICDLADKIHPIDLHPGEEIPFKPEEYNSPVFFIAHGEVQLLLQDKSIKNLGKGEYVGGFFQEGPSLPGNVIRANVRSVVFQINVMDFYLVLATQPALVQGLIKNVTPNKATMPNLD